MISLSFCTRLQWKPLYSRHLDQKVLSFEVLSFEAVRIEEFHYVATYVQFYATKYFFELA